MWLTASTSCLYLHALIHNRVKPSMSDSYYKRIYEIFIFWIRLTVENLGPALYRDFKQRRLEVRYRRFGITYRSHLQGSSMPGLWPLKIGPIGSSETSDIYYQYTFRNILEERRFLLHRCGSLKEGNAQFVWLKMEGMQWYGSTQFCARSELPVEVSHSW